MSDNAPVAPAAAPAVKAKPRWLVWMTRGLAVFAVVGGAIVAIAKLAEPYVLPNCDSKRSLDTVRSIFKDKQLPDPTLTDAKEVSHTKEEKLCQVAYAVPNEKGQLDYRVFWDDKDVKVLITQVRQ